MFSLFYAGFAMVVVVMYIILKILTQSWKPRLKEVVYVVLAGLPVAFLVALLVTSFLDPPLDGSGFWIPFSDMAPILFLFLYLYKIQSYSFKKSVILAFIAFIFLVIQLLVVLVILVPFIETLEVAAPLLSRGFGLVLMYAFPIIVVGLFVRFSRGIRKAIGQNQRVQNILLVATLLILVSIQISTLSINTFTEAYFRTEVILVAAYIIIAVISFVFYAKSVETRLAAKYELQQKETEQRELQYYTSEIEQQYSAMRKFQHDYQNILSSLDIFVEEDDWAGMKQYYTTRIKAASEVITKNDFALEALRKIKPREIKSILAAKLMLAQSMGIEAKFEADEEIETLPIDSVALVRMLGIILDNALEALTEQGGGTLLAGCFKAGDSVTFVVQNSCGPDIPKLYQLKQAGFSTKGAGRGLGLSNLSELADSCPNLLLETSITGGNFIQKIMIGES